MSQSTTTEDSNESETGQKEYIPLHGFTTDLAMFVEEDIRKDMFDNVFKPVNEDIRSAVEYIQSQPKHRFPDQEGLDSRIEARLSIWNEATDMWGEIHDFDEDGSHFLYHPDERRVFLEVDKKHKEEGGKQAKNDIDRASYASPEAARDW